MKRIISLLLALTLFFGVFGNLNIPAFATDVTETTEVETTEPETTEPETTEPETTEPETTEPESTEPETTEPETTVPETTEHETTEPETTEPETTEPETIQRPATIKLSQKKAGIIIKWSAVENAVSYNVYRKKGTGSWKSIAKKVTKQTFTDENTEVGVTYFYGVEACSKNKKSGYDKTGVSVVRLMAPSYIRSKNEIGGVRITWKAAEGAECYEVRRHDPDGVWKTIGITEKTEYLDSTVISGKKYEYTVKSMNGNSKSGSGNGGTKWFYDAPEIISVKNRSDGLEVSWKPVKGARSYSVYVWDTTSNTVLHSYDTKKTTRVDEKVVAYKSYKYTVIARGNYAISAYYETGVTKKFVPEDKWSKRIAFNFYKNAIENAKNTMPAYTLKSWQNIDSSKATGSNKAFAKEFNNAMKQSFFPISDPLLLRCDKGTKKSKRNLPRYKAKFDSVRSATATKEGKYIIVKLVMRNETSPELRKSGIAGISHNYFDLATFVEALKNEGTIYNGSSSSSTYKNFTITAKIKKNGEIVSMEHSCENIKLSMDLYFAYGLGNVKYNSRLDSYITYSKFKY